MTSRVRDDASEQPAKDVPASLVRGLDPVGDQERGRAPVLRDDLQRHVVGGVLAVPAAGQTLSDLQGGAEQVGLEDGVDVLEHRCDALER